MKIIILLISAILMVTFHMHGQMERFDILSFVAPHGWQRLDSNGKLGFFDSRTVNGATHFCQILLYPSHSSSGNPERDFTEEWENRIVRVTGTKEKPGRQNKKLPDGWNMITGYANINQQGSIYTSALTSITGYGKEISILVNVSGQDYLPAVDEFYKNLALDKNGSSNTNSNAQSSGISSPTGNYIYTVPQGWTSKQYPDGIVLSSPSYTTGEQCNITLWPMRNYSGNIQADGEALFSEVFKSFAPANGSTPGSIISGISAQGWEYYITKKSIVLKGGDFQSVFGFAFVAKLGGKLATITGISKDPLVSNCFGLQLNDVWPKFFYSLRFEGWSQSANNSQIYKTLPGIWMAVTATSGDRFVFAPNGRYAGASASQRYYQLSSNEVLRITDAYFGDGSYSINGNMITLVSDSDKNKPENGFLRIENESRNGGRTWIEKLYLLRKSAVDGSEYEVAYEKQNN
ncbi:MAG: hypothetical protein ACJ748_15210 [Flavisolibacter sp.]